MFSGKACVIRFLAHGVATLCGQNKLVSFPFDPFPHNFFRAADKVEGRRDRVNIRRIDKIDPCPGSEIQDSKSRGLVRLFPESHGAKTYFAYFKPGPTHTFE